MKKLRCGCYLNSITTNPECQWPVVSPTHGDCFWRFLASTSDRRGELPEFQNPEIAGLLGFSAAKVQVKLKAALAELKIRLDAAGLTEADFVAVSAHYARGPKRPPIEP